MNKLKLWLRRKVLHPWILKNKPECSVVLRDAIVYQMWAAGIGFGTINKWLAKMKCPTIKHYVMTKQGPYLYYHHLNADQRREITGQIVNII